MDSVSREKRGLIMAAVKGKNTTPEMVVRSLLHRMGYRFRLHKKTLPGRPDIYLARYKLAIFVHGCFWHRHRNCKYATMPKSNRAFWQKKFEQNIARDKSAIKALRDNGLRTLVLWECEIKSDNERLLQRLSDFLKSKAKQDAH